MGIEEVKEKAINCRKCELHEDRNSVVFGDGPRDADVMLIGEAPGYYEDQEGLPFVGKAGKLLDGILDSIGLSRDEIYITNILKCRPPNNANPTKEQTEKCTRYLDKQIELIDPKIIVTLGNFSTEYLLDNFNLKKDRIGKIHGKVFDVNTLTNLEKIIPVYHPAAATYDPSKEEVIEEDMGKVLDYV